MNTCAFVEAQDEKLNFYFHSWNQLMHAFFIKQNMKLSPAQTELQSQRLKSYLMSKAYSVIISPKGSSIEQRDQLLLYKMKWMKSQFQIREMLEFLDVKQKYFAHCPIDAVLREWDQLDTWIDPRVKLECIKRACAWITDMMKFGGGDQIPSMDDFLPLLILHLIVASPQRIHSNMRYIQRMQLVFPENEKHSVESL